MKVRETHYFAVPNGESTNYYRLRVFADTRLGVSEYRSGWFPAESVDRLFGNVTGDDSASGVAAREELKKAVNAAVLATGQQWLTAAQNPATDVATLQRLLVARRRILAYPNGEGPPFPGATEISYNPALGVFVHHADEKLLFVLSSNPDAVVEQIANFSEEDKTVLAVHSLRDVAGQEMRNQLAAQAATLAVRNRADQLLAGQIGDALSAVVDKKNPHRAADALAHIDILLNLLDASR